MKEKRRNIYWLGISSSVFLPNEMLDKCNFTAHVWCEHNVTMFGINKKKKKKLLGKKKVAKMFWFLACPCGFLSALISFSHFNETNVEYLRKVRMLRGSRQKCGKAVTFAGSGTGVCSTRSTTATAWCHHSGSPSSEAWSGLPNFLLTSAGCACGHDTRSTLNWNILAGQGRLLCCFPSCSSFCTELTYFCPAELSFWHFSQAPDMCLCITQVHIFNKEKGKSSIWPKN